MSTFDTRMVCRRTAHGSIDCRSPPVLTQVTWRPPGLPANLARRRRGQRSPGGREFLFGATDQGWRLRSNVAKAARQSRRYSKSDARLSLPRRMPERNDVQKPALGPVVQKIADSREVNTACLRVAGVVDLGSDSRLLHERRQCSGNIRFDRARCGWTMKSPPPGGLMNLADRPGLDRYDQRHRQRYCFNCSSNSSAEMPSSLSASARACSSSD